MGYCLRCGAEIYGKSHHKGGGEKKYCSRECSLNGMKVSKKMIRICEECGEPFFETRYKSIYCSRTCAGKAKRAEELKERIDEILDNIEKVASIDPKLVFEYREAKERVIELEKLKDINAYRPFRAGSPTVTS